MIHVDIFSWLWMILAFHHDDDQYLESWQCWWWWWWSTPRVVSWQWWHTGRGHLHRLFLPSSLLARDAIQNSGFVWTAKVIFFSTSKSVASWRELEPVLPLLWMKQTRLMFQFGNWATNRFVHYALIWINMNFKTLPNSVYCVND